MALMKATPAAMRTAPTMSATTAMISTVAGLMCDMNVLLNDNRKSLENPRWSAHKIGARRTAVGVAVL